MGKLFKLPSNSFWSYQSFLAKEYFEENLEKLTYKIYESFWDTIYISKSIIGNPLAAAASTVPS